MTKKGKQYILAYLVLAAVITVTIVILYSVDEGSSLQFLADCFINLLVVPMLFNTQSGLQCIKRDP